MKIALLFFISFFIFSTKLEAQKIENEFIILLNQNVEIKDFLIDAQEAKFPLKIKKILSKNSRIFLLEVADDSQNTDQILSFLKENKSILLAQFNHELKQRNTIPDDDYYLDQWQHFNSINPLADMDSQEAWNITTGGLTALGDTIVVAIVDNGVDINHEDLVPNLWHNQNEIPNNQIDDDGNGIVDDYYGFSAINWTGNIEGGAGHGTPIAGIIGAVGNNNKGITGINWNIKLMIIKTNYSVLESDVIAGYNYALEQRKLYNESNGRKGAFVVATNSSWGLDYGTASDAPIWCAFYDTLGKYGILNAVATANLNINVEVSGDLPSTCTSDYIVAVTNINRGNMLSMNTAYGAISIDLAAFGDGVFSIRNSNTYGIFGGTSSATPQVTGSIALAYSAMCENDILLARQQPNLIAQKVKNNILSSVQNNQNLTGITLSGGQLNLNNMVLKTLQNCYIPNSCDAPFNIKLLERQANSLVFTFSHFSTSDSFLIRSKKIDENTWNSTIIISDTFKLENLEHCNTYDFVLYTYCGGDISLDSTEARFTTAACCIAPEQSFYNTLVNNNILLKWSSVDIASNYQIQYRKENTQAWYTVQNVTDTSYTFTTLDNCSVYEYRIRILCNTTNQYSDFSTVAIFRTANCENCSIIDYCNQRPNSADIFQIDSIIIGNYQASIDENTSYILNTNILPNLWRGYTYNFNISQKNIQYSYVRVWIDYNQDGDFYDIGELVQSTVLSNVRNSIFSLQIPNNAKYGNTRIRIAIKEGNYPNLCENYANGQVIDFCTLISPITSIEEVDNLIKETYFDAIIDAQNITLTYKKENPLKSQIFVYNSLGQVLYQEEKVWQTNEQKNVNLIPFPKNIYYLVIKTEKEIFTYPF